MSCDAGKAIKSCLRARVSFELCVCESVCLLYLERAEHEGERGAELVRDVGEEDCLGPVQLGQGLTMTRHDLGKCRLVKRRRAIGSPVGVSGHSETHLDSPPFLLARGGVGHGRRDVTGEELEKYSVVVVERVSRVDAEHHDAGQKVRARLRDDRQDEA